MYLPAVMLQYELLGALHKQRNQIAFAVDGVLDEEYERAFATCGGAEKLPDLVLPSFKSTAKLVSEFIPPQVARRLGDLREVDELIERLEVVSEKLDSSESRLESDDRPDTRQLLRDELDRERKEKARLEQAISQSSARRLRTFDCAQLLSESLDRVQTHLVILSAFLGSDAVDARFLRQLEGALKRGVKVWIGYGMGKHGDRQQDREESANWSVAETELNNLRKRYKSSFKMRNFGDTHEKVLICDFEFVVSGSYNWLSFKANPRSKKRRHEDALMVTMPDVIKGYFEEITARFDADR